MQYDACGTNLHREYPQPNEGEEVIDVHPPNQSVNAHGQNMPINFDIIHESSNSYAEYDIFHNSTFSNNKVTNVPIPYTAVFNVEITMEIDTGCAVSLITSKT